jgi:hypothetical protein
MEQPRPSAPSRRWGRIGVVTTVIAATVLGAGAVAAQSPNASPVPGTTAPAPSVGSQKLERGRQQMGDRKGFRMPGQRAHGGRNDIGERGQGPRSGQGFGPGRGFGESGRPGMQRRLIERQVRRAITVTAVSGSTVSMATNDGWTRDVDTANVVISRDGQAITPADLVVGDTIRLAQTRNADGSYTVTGIEVQPAVTMGTVATVDTTGFTVTQADGTVVAVRVSDATSWLSRRGTAMGLDGLAVGAGVAAKGVRAADGSIDATVVAAARSAAAVPVAPDASTAPEASTEG